MTRNAQQESILVYADWDAPKQPLQLGTLYSMKVKGKEVFSFEYDDAWLKSGNGNHLDPDLHLYSGPQYLEDGKSNFGIFLDSSPDRWGRVLMNRREAVMARKEGRKAKTLFETDYLLGVYDGHRMGALRFKRSIDDPFLNSDQNMASPPWTSLRELEQASVKLEEDDIDDDEKIKWLNLLMAPGASLGGARPKAGVLDTKDQLWIAKFPSINDARDIGAWEMVVHDLALQAGLSVSEAMTQKFYSKQHTFLTKRFDRTENGGRIHFASAMTLLGHTDGTNHKAGVSYLDIVEFIIKNGVNVNEDLEELWRRIVFYICVSNTDDHLRNHGFLLTSHGWRLSPAYDMNPVETGNGLSLNISESDNAQEIDLAIEVAPNFRINKKRSDEIILEIKKSVSSWPQVARKYKIPNSEKELMEIAFRI